MTLFDSSVLIDYLAGDSTAAQYVEEGVDERAVAPSLVLLEVYQGELFRSGVADLEAVDDALSWVTVVEGIGKRLEPPQWFGTNYTTPGQHLHRVTLSSLGLPSY